MTMETLFELDLPEASHDIASQLPDGAVTVEVTEGVWILRASQKLQSRFEDLLEKKKVGQQTEEEQREFDAICGLDRLLSGFNRLSRKLKSEQLAN